MQCNIWLVRDSGCDKPKCLLQHVPSTIGERDIKQLLGCQYVNFKSISNEARHIGHMGIKYDSRLEYNNVTLSFDTVGQTLRAKSKWNGKKIKENYTLDIAIIYLHGMSLSLCVFCVCSVCVINVAMLLGACESNKKKIKGNE